MISTISPNSKSLTTSPQQCPRKSKFFSRLLCTATAVSAFLAFTNSTQAQNQWQFGDLTPYQKKMLYPAESKPYDSAAAEEYSRKSLEYSKERQRIHDSTEAVRNYEYVLEKLKRIKSDENLAKELSKTAPSFLLHELENARFSTTKVLISYNNAIDTILAKTSKKNANYANPSNWQILSNLHESIIERFPKPPPPEVTLNGIEPYVGFLSQSLLSNEKDAWLDCDNYCRIAAECLNKMGWKSSSLFVSIPLKDQMFAFYPSVYSLIRHALLEVYPPNSGEPLYPDVRDGVLSKKEANESIDILRYTLPYGKEDLPKLLEIAGHYHALAHFSRISGESEKSGENYKKALSICDKAIASDPKFADAHVLRARLLQNYVGPEETAEEEHYRLIEAIISYNTAISLAPDDWQSLVEIGLLKTQMGFEDEAQKDFRKALEIDSNNPFALQALGLYFYSKGALKEAWEYLAKSNLQYRGSFMDDETTMIVRELQDRFEGKGKR